MAERIFIQFRKNAGKIASPGLEFRGFPRDGVVRESSKPGTREMFYLFNGNTIVVKESRDCLFKVFVEKENITASGWLPASEISLVKDKQPLSKVERGGGGGGNWSVSSRLVL